ncbi:MAG: sulfotransferase domain-containing protein [Pseudomonadota bacterium]
MKQLDFIIIGAQKSATTSLFKYLSEHQNIHMPADKEAPFFSDEKLYKKGWESFAQNYFSGVSEEKLWGTASPQYMGDPRAPQRIAKQNPQVKLIAILRNPIDRVYSHYSMSVRREIEHRDFDSMVKQLLSKDHLSKYRNKLLPDHSSGYSLIDDNNEDADNNYYCVWSEYGRILTHYNRYFSKQQLLILYMDDLMKNPQQCINKVTRFLGFKEIFSPANIGKIYHKGGNKVYIPQAWKELIKANSLFRLCWSRVPKRSKSYINYWYEQLNVRNSGKVIGPSNKAKEQLTDHFLPDIKRLEVLFDTKVPWSEFKM